MKKRVIRRVLFHKGAKIMWVTVPKWAGIKVGDYVEITKVK